MFKTPVSLSTWHGSLIIDADGNTVAQATTPAEAERIIEAINGTIYTVQRVSVEALMEDHRQRDLIDNVESSVWCGGYRTLDGALLAIWPEAVLDWNMEPIVSDVKLELIPTGENPIEWVVKMYVWSSENPEAGYEEQEDYYIIRKGEVE